MTPTAGENQQQQESIPSSGLSAERVEEIQRRAKAAAEVRRLRSHLATAGADSARLDTAQQLLSGADFAYGDPDAPRAVVVLDIPQGVRVGADFRAFLDAARSRTPTPETVPHD